MSAIATNPAPADADEPRSLSPTSATLPGLARATDNIPLKVLVVDDQDSARVAIAAELDHAGHQVLEAHDAQWALELFARHRPDLVLLDVTMPLLDGYWLARQLREAESGSWTPIIFLSARDQDLDLWRGIEAGGDDYLVKPVSPVVLHAKMRAMQRLQGMRSRLMEMSEELRTANERLRHLSEVDELTGLVNRRGFAEILHQRIVEARAQAKPLTLMLCDVDYFKAYNDAFGHVEGDACLRDVADVLRRACRRTGDLATRYGGEEFALILPNTPRSGAMTFARALMRLMEALGRTHPGNAVAGHVTMSGGITTCYPDETTTSEGMVQRADEALYAAKRQGRNRFFSFEMQADTLQKRLG
jgi:diguanylate cyclase (GGDEF)-like protein